MYALAPPAPHNFDATLFLFLGACAWSCRTTDASRVFFFFVLGSVNASIILLSMGGGVAAGLRCLRCSVRTQIEVTPSSLSSVSGVQGAALVKTWVSAMAHPRYLKVGGRPVYDAYFDINR